MLKAGEKATCVILAPFPEPSNKLWIEEEFADSREAMRVLATGVYGRAAWVEPLTDYGILPHLIAPRAVRRQK